MHPHPALSTRPPVRRQLLCLLVLTFDQSENDKGWADSQGMLMKEVIPQFAGM